MSELKRQLVRLAHANPDGIREHLLPILLKTGKGDEGEEEEGKGKGPGKLLMTFLREMGDKEVPHPDPGGDPGKKIKIKSLQAPADRPLGGWRATAYKKLFDREFSKWRKKFEQRKKQEGGKGKEKD